MCGGGLPVVTSCLRLSIKTTRWAARRLRCFLFSARKTFARWSSNCPNPERRTPLCWKRATPQQVNILPNSAMNAFVFNVVSTKPTRCCWSALGPICARQVALQLGSSFFFCNLLRADYASFGISSLEIDPFAIRLMRFSMRRSFGSLFFSPRQASGVFPTTRSLIWRL